MTTPWIRGLYRRSYTRFYSVYLKPERPDEILGLTSPIGVTKPPKVSDNTGEDTRTLEEKRKDFTDMQKRRQRTEELKQQLFQTSFKSIYGFRHTGGKFFRAPNYLFTPETAKFMPNFRGVSLQNVEQSSCQFYGNGKPSLLRIFSSTLSKKQIDTYTSGLDLANVGFPLIDINTPTSWFNEKLVKLFSFTLRKEILGPHHNYLIARKGVTHSLRESIWAGNELGGYIYLIDGKSRIRWAASGPATKGERDFLQNILSKPDFLQFI